MVRAGSSDEEAALTLSLPPLFPTLPEGASQRGFPGTVSVVATTVTFTESVAVPNASVTEIWKVSTGGVPQHTTGGAVKLGVRLLTSVIGTNGPAVCVHWMVASPALMSWVILL